MREDDSLSRSALGGGGRREVWRSVSRFRQQATRRRNEPTGRHSWPDLLDDHGVSVGKIRVARLMKASSRRCRASSARSNATRFQER
jgi:hypothetical protein